MAELRQDPTTGYWVVIAGERAKRPHDFKKIKETPKLPERDEKCPFCPGNEYMTPPEVLSYPDGRGGWRLRAFPNKFPVLTPQGSLERRVVDGHFNAIDGVGFHEVIVETSKHNRFTQNRELEEVEDMLKSYRDRYAALKGRPEAKAVVIFKNEGAAAGTSLIHPHSQLIATPIVPRHMWMNYKVAERYLNDNGRCVYRDLEKWEREAGRRVVLENGLFTVFNPYASHQPYETWIVPKRDEASFGAISDEEMRGLARVLRDIIGRLCSLLDNPDYNWVIHTAPFGDEEKRYYLWHMRIIPRLTIIAGFELGSDMYINTVSPEDAAAYLRNTK